MGVDCRQHLPATAPEKASLRPAIRTLVRAGPAARWRTVITLTTRPRLTALGALAAALLSLAAGVPVRADVPESATQSWAAEIGQLATRAAKAAFPGRHDVRVEVEVGALDPRLKLAPCRRVDLRLPPGQRPWGRTRVGVRCVDGSVPWNVYLPLTVKVFAPALVATQSLAAGTVLQPEHLKPAEVDWAGAASPVVVRSEAAVGRTLALGLAAGEALREADLRRRVWFAAGDTVRVLARGDGFVVGGEGVALNPGVEGQPVRVKTEGGRTITGVAAAERQVEVRL